MKKYQIQSNTRRPNTIIQQILAQSSETLQHLSSQPIFFLLTKIVLTENICINKTKVTIDIKFKIGFTTSQRIIINGYYFHNR